MTYMVHKIRILIAILVVVVFSCNKKGTSSNKRNDSVEKYLKLASIDTLPLETRKKYNNKAFSFIDLEKNDTTVRWYLSEVTFNTLDFKDSLDYFEKSKFHYQKSIERNDTLNLARFYRYRGGFHKVVSFKMDSSFYYYLKSEKLYETTNKSDEFAILLNSKHLIQENLGDYLGVEYTITKSYNMIKNKKIKEDYYDFLNTLGNMNHNMGKYNLAINYHIKALELSKTYNLKRREKPISYQGTSLNNLGNAYRELKEYKKAIYYFKKAIEVNEMFIIDYELKGYIYNNIGFCYMKSNIKTKKTFKYFIEAAKVFDSLKIKNESAISRIYLAEYYAKIKDTSKAIEYADEALKLAKESKSGYYYLYCLSNAGAINKKKAPKYIAEYHRLNDSLLFEERKARNQYFKIQLETDEIAQEKEKAIKQKWLQTSIIAGFLIIVILLFIIYKQRSQKKEFILIQNQQKANEEIYQLMLAQQKSEELAKHKEKRRIALELHDNVMNRLASTRFNLFTLTQKINPETLQNAQQHIQTIKEIEDEIRNLTHELSKEEDLKENSFTSVIQQFIEQQKQIFTTDYRLDMDERIDWGRIDSEIKINWYRILQEAIHNCNKYAEASAIIIRIAKNSNHLTLNIKDNGKGFDTTQKKQGIGLENMQQRIQSIKGEMTITSALQKGTEIHCSVEIKD